MVRRAKDADGPLVVITIRLPKSQAKLLEKIAKGESANEGRTVSKSEAARMLLEMAIASVMKQAEDARRRLGPEPGK